MILTSPRQNLSVVVLLALAPAQCMWRAAVAAAPRGPRQQVGQRQEVEPTHNAPLQPDEVESGV